MARVYLSVGSNVDRDRSVRSGLAALRSRYGALDLSPVYESRAVGFSGDDFYNLVVGFDTGDTVHEVADALHVIEAQHGRSRHGQRFAPRTLDLDLLLYGDLVLHEPGLELPRAEIERYAFVLRPLADIAGAERHPVSGRTYAELWAAFDASEQPMWPAALAFPEPET